MSAKSEISTVKKSEMKMSLISLYFTFYHFFSDAEVKVGKETVKFLAIFDHHALTARSSANREEQLKYASPITHRAPEFSCRP
jgi:hypothetical protein